MITNNYSTTPKGDGQSPDQSSPNKLKYTFDPAKSVLVDCEVFPGPRWCCGFLLYHNGLHKIIDGDREALAAILDQIAARGWTLYGYNSADYDLPILRAILAGEDAYLISRAIVNYEGWGLPPELRERAARWPTIRADHVDLCARTRDSGHFPSLKRFAANLGAKHLQELPYSPDQPLTDEEWEEVKQYNRKDLRLTRLVFDHFAPELTALAALSNRYGMDLRSVHQAQIAAQILCTAYRTQHGMDPVRIVPSASVRYQPPGEVRRPQHPVPAGWYDRITTEAFPMILAKGASHPRPVVPESPEPIEIGGARLNVGSGGTHSVDGAALHRPDDAHAVYETDVASFYPNMMAQFGIFPTALGDVGLEEYREILAERLAIKEQAARSTDPAESQRLKTMADGLKIVLNSVFGQFGNPYSVLYDPEAMLAVTLSGQLLLLDLVERLAAAGASILSVNTDGLFFRVPRDSDAWHKVLANWESDTGMILETAPVNDLLIEATNNYCVRYADGSSKRRGTLGGSPSWRNVPNNLVVADAVLAALLDGVLPERTVHRCVDPARFVSITRRDGGKVGVLIDEDTGAETPLPKLTRWYKAKDSPLRIEHRWTDGAGKAHKTTPPGASGIQLLQDLPELGQVLGDIDYTWYVGAARSRIFAVRDGFPHLAPKWLSGPALDLHARGLAPSPHWAGKHSPRGARKDHPSYFWEWQNYHTFGTYTGPQFGILVLDVDLPDKFRKWLGDRGLTDCMVSYHRKDSASAVRAGEAKGKLIFKFEAGADHPLAKVGKAALRQALGVEVFYGHGDPSVLGEHPDGPEHEYMLDGSLGSPPPWLIADLVERATKKVRAPKDPGVGGNGKPVDSVAVAKYATAALESEVSQVAAAPEGERNSTLWKASCAIGGLVGAGVVDREEVEEKLVEATTLPIEEAVDVVRRGLDRGAEAPRDLGHVGRNGDGLMEPVIEITTEEYAVNDQAVAALAADPDLYQRGHTLVRVLRTAPRPDDDEWGRDPGSPVITQLHPATLRERLTQFATWITVRRGKDDEKQIILSHPPEWAIKAVFQRGTWDGIRPLELITEVPVFLPNGEILDRPGYHEPSGILYTPEAVGPKVPEAPSWDDARSALRQLYDVVVDFPFVSEEHKSVWVAAVLTLLARPAIFGPTPLFAFDANTAGSGKTLLCDLVSIIGTGRCVGRTALPAAEEEMAKVLLALALGGSRLVLFDNGPTGGAIGGPALDAALTATTYSGRVLGASKFATDVPFKAVFCTTGNNIALKADTLRRVLLCRLESLEERPEERDDFRTPNLLAYVREHRATLAMHALLILRAYHVAGRPTPSPKPKPMGGFEGWSDLVRRAVHWASGCDPCATKAEAKSTDKTATQLPGLIEGWARLCRSAGADSLSVAQALKLLENHPSEHELLKALLTESTRDGRLPTPNSLGNLLGKIRGRAHSGRSLERTESYGVNRWFVKAPKAPPPAQPDGDEPPF